MKKKKNNEPDKGGHGVGVGVFDLMGMASAESEGVGVGRERGEILLGRRRRSVWGLYWTEGKMVFLLHSANLHSTTITPKRVIKQPQIIAIKSMP
jgi:hypothetical protein